MGRSVLYCGGTRSHFMRMVRLMTWSLASLLTGGGVGVGPGIGVDPGVAPAGVVLEEGPPDVWVFPGLLFPVGGGGGAEVPLLPPVAIFLYF